MSMKFSIFHQTALKYCKHLGTSSVPIQMPAFPIKCPVLIDLMKKSESSSIPWKVCLYERKKIEFLFILK